MNAFKNICKNCNVREACAYTFGKFYSDKSCGGIGCNFKIGDADWAARVMAIANAEKRRLEADAKPAPKPAQTDEGGVWHKYEVRHLGEIYKTTAKSEAQAVNCVRFKLYGQKPLAECAPFEAYQVAESPMTKSDALARLRRMAS